MTRYQTISAYCFLALAQIMVGINIVGTKFLLSSVSILFLLTIRFSLASILLFVLFILTNNKKNNHHSKLRDLNKTDWIYLIAQALTAGVLFNFMMIWGLNYTSASLAGIITSALPALTALMSSIVFKEQFTLKMGLCIAFATLGLIIISISKLGGDTHYSLFGVVLILLALIPEASYYVLSKCYTNKLPLFLVSALLNGINAIILLPIWLFSHPHHLLNLPTSQWLILITIGLSTGLFYVFWYTGAAKVAPVKASLSTALMPIATVLLAWISLGELLTASQFVGMCLVILSIITYVFS